MLKYEYLTITRRSNQESPVSDALDLSNKLNEYAVQGWWLFAIYPQQDGTEKIVFERTQEKYGHNRNAERTLN